MEHASGGWGVIHYQETQYGFEYGSAKVNRLYSDEKTESVTIGIDSQKSRVQVYVTKTGKIRVYKDGNELIAR